MNNTQARRVDDSHYPDPDLIPTDPVIDGVKKLDDWLEHREIVVQELCPVGALETLYTERAALYLWRLDRAIGFENEETLGGLEAGTVNKREDSQESRVNRVSPDQSKLQTIIKYEAHLVRCLSGTMAELRRLQKDRRQGLRDANPGGGGADRAGVCQNQQIQDGSPGGSPSQIRSPAQTDSPTRQINGAEMSIPGGRGADRIGVCQNQQIQDGSPGGSPSQIGSPSRIGSPAQTCLHIREINGAEMSIPGGRGADRAGVCQHQQIQNGSPGGSPSQIGSPARIGSPIQVGSPSQIVSPALKSSTARKNSTPRSVSRPQRTSPIPKPPPLLASITNRRRLEEYTLGEIFEPRSLSSTLNFAMIPSK